MRVIVQAAIGAQAPTLAAEPGALFFFADFGAGKAEAQTLNLRTRGDGQLNWTASEDTSWLGLDAPLGTTPADLLVSIDSTGLGVGTHSTQITVTTGAGTETVDVWLTIRGEAVYLPLVLR